MAILIKNSTVAGKIPLPGDLQIGELAMNSADGKLFMKTSDGTVLQFVGGSTVPPSTAIAIAHAASPYVTAYKWDNATGFGTKYADPATLPNSTAWAVTFSPDNTSIAIGHDFGPHFSAYHWNNATGFGTRYANASDGGPQGGTVTDLSFSPNGNYLAIITSSAGSPIYEWNSTTGFTSGNQYFAPAVGNTSGNAGTFSPSGNAYVVSQNNGPSISAWVWTNTPYPNGFGTKYANPSGAPTGGTTGSGVSFSPDGLAIALSTDASPFINTWAWSDATGFGTKYSNPSVLPNTFTFWCEYAPDGKSIAVSSQSASPWISAYPWNSTTGFGTKYADPSTLPTGGAHRISFSRDSKCLAISHDGSPYVSVYPWSSTTGFGVKYSDPSTLPTNNAYGVTFN
jgi:hypothetical protein